MKRLRLLLLLSLILLTSCNPTRDSQDVNSPSPLKSTPERLRKVFYVNSYHQGYAWSDRIEQTIRTVLQNEAGNFKINLSAYHMDSKRKNSLSEIMQAAQEALQQINREEPDIIIVSDDNAIKYLVVPYLLSRKIPIIFCGVNWDSKKYNLPENLTTGMLEVQRVDQLVKGLSPYAKGDRIAFLKGDDESARIEAQEIKNKFLIPLDLRLVKNFKAWQQQYLKLQEDADILILGNAASIPDWDKEQAREFILKNTRIPSGCWDSWMAAYCLETLATRPEEQGAWVARTALRVLQGVSTADIPQVYNQQTKIYLNMPLANRLNIRFAMNVIEAATLIGE